MTLLIGIVCSDGAVLAADRQTTHGDLAGLTVGHSASKISRLKQNALVASSGHRGLGQQLAAALEPMCDGFPRQLVADSLINVQKAHRALVVPAYDTAKVSSQVLGQNSSSDVICHSIMISNFKDGLHVVEITPNGAVERLTGDLPYLCLGSGKQNADPFLGFLWSVFMPSGALPSMNEGTLLAFWTISNSIKLATSGVGLGIDIFNIKTGLPSIVSQVSKQDFDEHNGFIFDVEVAMRAVRDNMGSASATTPPPVFVEKKQ